MQGQNINIQQNISKTKCNTVLKCKNLTKINKKQTIYKGL